ncbi:hypothetical protein B0H17DRAFT_1193802 [Mycena rosella]|uniref:Uncharacterized protein n=1 Tax=Mycena rosella TaxID=1033263 RepID=A0AAD7GT62_MYCRO|nr:hypothetical protein B0H17DRAFT_1193802 [Mycena rosella]
MPPFAAQLDCEFSADDFNDDQNLSVLRHCQRRIVELEEQLAKGKATKTAPTPLKNFTSLGHAICKVILTFENIDVLIAENDRRMDLEQTRNEGDEVHKEEEEHTLEQNRAYNGYKELLRFIPAFRQPLMEAEHDDLLQILNALRHGARNARSDDTKNVKAAIVPWLQKLFPEMTALDPDSREERGAENPWILTILSPTEYDITIKDWFIGLYPHKKFDPENQDLGLFKNVMLLMVWKYIFTSPISIKSTVPHEDRENDDAPPAPSSSSTSRRKKAKPATKRSVASIIGLTRVTGRSIAYAAVQYCVALSDAHHWDEHNGSFDYIKFYNNVVDFFEFPRGRSPRLM